MRWLKSVNFMKNRPDEVLEEAEWLTHSHHYTRVATGFSNPAFCALYWVDVKEVLMHCEDFILLSVHGEMGETAWKLGVCHM